MKINKYPEVLICFILLLCFVTFGCFFRISSIGDMRAYYGMCFSEEYHPIWKKLALRQITKGQKMKPVLEKWPPQRITKKDNISIFTYWLPENSDLTPYTGISLTVKDNKINTAELWSCTSHYCFFGNSVMSIP